MLGPGALAAGLWATVLTLGKYSHTKHLAVDHALGYPCLMANGKPSQVRRPALKLRAKLVSMRLSAAALIAASGLLACGAPQVHLPQPSANCDSTQIKDCQARCDNNEGRACYRLGWFYEDGDNVDKDLNHAMKLYERACDANWAVACRALGEIYWRGTKVERNRKKGIEYFSKACGLGLDIACPTAAEIALAEGRRRAAKPKSEAGFGVSVSADGELNADAPATSGSDN